MSSTNDTHYADLSTGLKVTILKGGHNFTTWFKDLKHVARCKSIWGMFFDDPKQPRLAKPVLPCVPNFSDIRSYRIDGDMFYQQGNFDVSKERLVLIHQAAMKEWDFACQQWEKQQGKIEEASLLLFASVEPSLLEEITADEDLPGVVLAMILKKFCGELPA